MPRGTHARQSPARPSRLHMARRRGAVTGPLLMMLGAWGMLVPFVGHAFGFGYTPDNTWTWTAARGWLEVLPGAGALLGGALLTVTTHRVLAAFGGWVAAISGAWFALGTVVAPWWSPGFIGTPSGDADRAVWEQLGMFTGLGIVIVCLAGIALGRASVVSVRDAASTQAQLDALQKIERAPAYSYFPDPVPADNIDLIAAEHTRESAAATSPQNGQ